MNKIVCTFAMMLAVTLAGCSHGHKHDHGAGEKHEHKCEMCAKSEAASEKAKADGTKDAKKTCACGHKHEG